MIIECFGGDDLVFCQRATDRCEKGSRGKLAERMKIEAHVMVVFRIQVWISNIQSQRIGIIGYRRQLCDVGLAHAG